MWLFIAEYLLACVPVKNRCPLSAISRLVVFGSVWWASGLLKQLLLILQDYIGGHSAHYQFVPTQKLKAFLPDDIVENYNK